MDWIKETICVYAANPPDWACDGLNDNDDNSGTDGNKPFEIQIFVEHDDFPRETSWQLMDQDGHTLRSQEPGTVHGVGSIVRQRVPVGPGEFTFIMYDDAHDGICCGYGAGRFEIVVNGAEVYSGGDFGSSTGPLEFVIDDQGFVSPNATANQPWSDADFKIEIIIEYGENPQQTSWQLIDEHGHVVARQAPEDPYPFQQVNRIVWVYDGMYTFSFQGEGYYEIKVDGNEVAYDDHFGNIPVNTTFYVGDYLMETYLIVQ